MSAISRRAFTLTSAAGIGAALSTMTARAREKNETSTPPNIVFLLTDDQRRDALGCMGNPFIQTPHIDAMAKEGVIFDNTFVTTSICAPSRASILSGQYVCRHGIDDFAKTFDDTAFAQTYPALLREAGYTTGFVGKYGIGNVMPEDRFDYWRGYAGQGHYETEDESGNPLHLTQKHENDALAFLDRYAKNGPFCLSVSFKAPHCQDGDPRQFIYDPMYEDLYRDVDVPVPETADDRFYEAFPEFFRDNNEGRNRWQIRFSNPQLYQDMVKAYYRLITGVDRVVGALRARLDALGVADNTVIVFTSDNGFFLGERGLAGKWFGYDASIRVPLVIYDPQLPESARGTRRAEMALNIDLAPTLLTIAGISPPPAMQGIDLGPALRDEKRPWRDAFFYEHTFAHPGIPKSEGVVSSRYKYLRYIDQSPVYEELFDLSNDPQELHNLTGDPEHDAALEMMRIWYERLKAHCCA